LWIEESGSGENGDNKIVVHPRGASASRAPVLERARDFFIRDYAARAILFINGCPILPPSLKENPK
jgi:hypothetical protein